MINNLCARKKLLPVHRWECINLSLYIVVDLFFASTIIRNYCIFYNDLKCIFLIKYYKRIILDKYFFVSSKSDFFNGIPTRYAFAE